MLYFCPNLDVIVSRISTTLDKRRVNERFGGPRLALKSIHLLLPLSSNRSARWVEHISIFSRLCIPSNRLLDPKENFMRLFLSFPSSKSVRLKNIWNNDSVFCRKVALVWFSKTLCFTSVTLSYLRNKYMVLNQASDTAQTEITNVRWLEFQIGKFC